MLTHCENVYAPYYESSWNSSDCVEIEDIKVILRLQMKYFENNDIDIDC